MVRKKKEPDKEIKKSLYNNNNKIDSDYITIKTSLKSILNKDKFDFVNNLVIECNEYVIRTYQFMRLYFLHCYYNKIEFPIIDKQNILNFLKALSKKDNLRGAKPKNTNLINNLDNFYKIHFKNLINKDKFNLLNKSHLIPKLAEQIYTGYKNNIKEHFITRFRHFMNVNPPNFYDIDILKVKYDIKYLYKYNKEEINDNNICNITDQYIINLHYKYKYKYNFNIDENNINNFYYIYYLIKNKLKIKISKDNINDIDFSNLNIDLNNIINSFELYNNDDKYKKNFKTNLKRLFEEQNKNNKNNKNEIENCLKKEKKRVFNIIKNAVLKDEIELKVPNNYKEYANNIKKKYLPKTYKNSYYYDCHIEENFNKYLFLMIKMNENMESRNDIIDKQILETVDEKLKIQLQMTKIKLFEIIPQRNSFTPHYISFDTNVILELLKEKGESHIDITTNKKYIYNKLFKFDKKIFTFKKNNINYEVFNVSTDGIGASILFSKGKHTKTCKKKIIISDDDLYLEDLNDENLEILKNKNIVALDPGKGGSVLLDKNKKKLNYTTVQRRKESLRKRNSNILKKEKIKEKIDIIENELSLLNFKTVSFEKFKKVIIKKTEIYYKVRPFYEQLLIRKLKFRTQIYLRKSEDKFLNNIKNQFGSSEDIVIAYGNWSQERQTKNCLPSINQGLKKIIEKKYKVFMIDEYCTSKLCSCCHKILKNYTVTKLDNENYLKKHKVKFEEAKRFKNNQEENKKFNNKIHRLLICKGCSDLESKKTTFWNRDINACQNMLNLCSEWINNKTRNILFTRETNPDTNLEIGKIEVHKL